MVDDTITDESWVWDGNGNIMALIDKYPEFDCSDEEFEEYDSAHGEWVQNQQLMQKGLEYKDWASAHAQLIQQVEDAVLFDDDAKLFQLRDKWVSEGGKPEWSIYFASMSLDPFVGD